MTVHEALEGRRPDVAEIYSRPRVTAMAKKMHLQPGFALDLTLADEYGEPCDFRRLDHRQRARDMVRTQKPWLLIGCPPCTWYSQMQRRNWHNMSEDEMERRKFDA